MLGLFGDILKVATLPLAVVAPVVRVTVDAARIVTKPVGDAAAEVARSINEATK